MRPLVEKLLAFLIVVGGVLSGLGIFLWVTGASFKSPLSLSDCSAYAEGTPAPESCQFLILPLSLIGIALPLVVIVDLTIGWKKLFSEILLQTRRKERKELSPVGLGPLGAHTQIK